MTTRSSTYNTWQRRALTAYLESLNGAHITAEELAHHFATTEKRMGRTTVYRHLGHLVKDGLVRRFTTGNTGSACYQYIAEPEHCAQHFHLRCTVCGQLQHIDCEELSRLAAHIAADHAFTLDVADTLFTGTCAHCRS